MGQDQRSIKNIKHTSKYHFLYIGNVLLVSLGLVVLLYLMILKRIIEMTLGQDPEIVQGLVASVTIGAIAVGALVTLVALLQAHRVSGVHIKLRHTFDRVAAGDMNTKLTFRKSDRLTDVEESFNAMMAAIRAKLPEDEVAEKSEEDSND